MANEPENDKKGKQDHEDDGIKPDPETLNTTDPQEHMKGPVSSLMQELGEGFDDQDAEKKPKENES